MNHVARTLEALPASCPGMSPSGMSTGPSERHGIANDTR